MKTKGIFSQHPEQFSFVNQYGTRFLKSRIQMMNRIAKSRRSWLVYGILFAVTGLVTTMAAVEKSRKPPLVLAKKKPVLQPKSIIEKPTVIELTAPVVESKTVQKPLEKLVEKPVIIPDSVQVIDEIPLAEPAKKSRYVVQQGDQLFWVITPKMSFTDLSELKQDIETRTHYTFDFTQIKFDPFQVYIGAIGVNVHMENGSSGSTSRGGETNEPIKSIGGYVTTKERGSLGIGGLQGETSLAVPTELKQLVKEDEEAIAKLVEEKRMAYFILKNKKTGLGSSSTVKGEWLLENRGRRNEGLGVFVDDGNRVQLYHPENVTVFIDGKEVKAEEVTYLNPKQLHTVIISDFRNGPIGSGLQKRYVQLFLNPW